MGWDGTHHKQTVRLKIVFKSICVPPYNLCSRKSLYMKWRRGSGSSNEVENMPVVMVAPEPSLAWLAAFLRRYNATVFRYGSRADSNACSLRHDPAFDALSMAPKDTTTVVHGSLVGKADRRSADGARACLALSLVVMARSGFWCCRP